MADTVEVLEVDQWTSTGNVRELDWDTLKADGIAAVSGGDSEAVRRISGGTFRFRTVQMRDRPSLARVWFRRGEQGQPEFYAANYDSSD